MNIFDKLKGNKYSRFCFRIFINLLVVLNLVAIISYFDVFKRTDVISDFQPESGYCYTYVGYPFYQNFNWYKFNFNYKLLNLFISSDSMKNNYGSKMVVYENGIPLGPPHSQHIDIRESGMGSYSQWGSSIFLSTSDNSNPNTNNKKYSIQYPLTFPFPVFLVMFFILSGLLFRRKIARILSKKFK